jgi:type II secretory pathway component PulF
MPILGKLQLLTLKLLAMMIMPVHLILVAHIKVVFSFQMLFVLPLMLAIQQNAFLRKDVFTQILLTHVQNLINVLIMVAIQIWDVLKSP